MSKKLNESQCIAVQMLLNGYSGKAIAESLNIAAETISRWRKLPEFQVALNEELDAY
ncbi:MAG: Helix-turn-helix of insertion element transposase [Chlamydiales bacterium]|jgi:uncharacterized protein YjcR|nr:Helix-turn-helix of insertion element transposase [Chlamydiales bacterium]